MTLKNLHGDNPAKASSSHEADAGDSHSRSLKTDPAALATTDELKQLHLLKSVDPSVVEAVLGDCPVQELMPDEPLIKAGEASKHLYLVLSGRLRVHLSPQDASPVAVIEPGESVGEISIMDHQPASANVIADTRARVLVVDERTLWQLIQRSHAVAYNMLFTLAQRLRYGNSVINQIKKLLREYEYDATVDPLTGLYNRRWLDNMLMRLMQRCRSSHQPFSAIMIDIDFFKQYNDTHGHIAGDRALRTLSHCHTRARVLVVDERTLWQLIQRSHAVAYNMLFTLAQRLRYGNSVINQIKKLLREYEYDATVDPLTGLYNRRWLDNMLMRLMQRCRSSHQPFSAIMIDIDFFKQYNDTHGHIAGDRALRTLSHCLMNNLRPKDLMTRYGGEELIALLPGSNLEDARQVAERLRIAVGLADISLSDGTKLPSLTISLGIAQMHPDDTPERLIAAADAALYRAKRGGRNRICD